MNLRRESHEKSQLLVCVCACILFMPITAYAASVPLPELEGYYAPGGGLRTLPDGTIVDTKQTRVLLFENYPVYSDPEEVSIDL